MRVLVALALALALTPFASAGTAEAPELTDAAGDCANPAGNTYADITSAWVADETATHFNVYITLAEFLDPAGTFTGYTVQFKHQGVQFGVVAFYNGNGDWDFDNAYIGEEGFSEFQPAEGSFTAGTPALLKIAFDKSNFPHGDASDNKLIDFTAGSADLKSWVPFFIAGQNPPTPMQICDEAVGTGSYEFTVGGHAMHGSSTSDDTSASADGDAETNTTATPTTVPLETASAPQNETPGPGLALVVAGAALALLARRRA